MEISLRRTAQSEMRFSPTAGPARKTAAPVLPVRLFIHLRFATQCWSGRSARAAGAMGNSMGTNRRVRTRAKPGDLERQSTAWKRDEVPHVWVVRIRFCKLKPRLHALQCVACNHSAENVLEICMMQSVNSKTKGKQVPIANFKFNENNFEAPKNSVLGQATRGLQIGKY